MLDFYYLAGYFDSSLSFPGLSVSPNRVVDLYEMEFFFEDGVTYINDKPYTVTAGTVLTVCPGAVRHSRLPLRNYYIKIGHGGDEFFDFFRSFPMLWKTGISDICRSCIQEILIGRAQHNPYRVSAGFCSLFAALQEERDRFRNAGVTLAGSVMDDAIRYMEAHLSEPCPLAEIAASVHLSPVYFHNRFREATGETPLSYLTRIRVEKAKVLLLSDSTPTAEIAEQCGFSSDTYFSAVFKKHTGQTPRQYRIRKMKAYWD